MTAIAILTACVSLFCRAFCCLARGRRAATSRPSTGTTPSSDRAAAGATASAGLERTAACHRRFVCATPRRPTYAGSIGSVASRVVHARHGLSEFAAAWWSVRRDSSAVLYVARQPDSGRTWGTPTAVDTTDVSSVGCRRPPPSLVDSRRRRARRVLDGRARRHGRVLRAHHGRVCSTHRFQSSMANDSSRPRSPRTRDRVLVALRGAERNAPADRRRALGDRRGTLRDCTPRRRAASTTRRRPPWRSPDSTLAVSWFETSAHDSTALASCALARLNARRQRCTLVGSSARSPRRRLRVLVADDDPRCATAHRRRARRARRTK